MRGCADVLASDRRAPTGDRKQVLATYALQGVISTAAAISFSLGMQLGVTFVNTIVGVLATMVLFRTVQPVAAARLARARFTR